MLIFNNEEHYNNLIENGFEKYPNNRDLIILCQHWLKDGVPKKDLIDNMVDFCTHWNSQFNYIKSENLLNEVVKQIEKLEKNPPSFKFNTNIVVFESEIDGIKTIKDKNLQKIAFVFMVLAKWRNANYIYLNSKSSIKLQDVFNFAGIKCTGKERFNYLHMLNNSGFVEVQLKPIDKFIIPCIVSEGKEVLNFTINDNLIENWNNIVCPHCERCGKWFEIRGKNNKYCTSCSKEVRKEQDRLRKKKK